MTNVQMLATYEYQSQYLLHPVLARLVSLPVPQLVQTADPAASLYFPASHSVQVADPAELYFPASHSVQVADPAELYFPAAHFEHSCPLTECPYLKVPAGHFSHTTLVICGTNVLLP